jgi:anaerobic magnesium-protoporphyrin IX monomethyl ester cyclase
MKVLLTTLNAKYIHTNLAIRLLYGLNREWPGLEWREFTINQDRDEIARFCVDFEVVAFSCYIWNITQTLELARKMKAINPSVRILLGGPEVSYDWQDVIVRQEVDFIITGEGETPFREFLYAWPEIGHLANLVSKAENGEIRYFNNPVTFELENYRHIRPWQYDPPDELRSKVLYVETSRGCPYKCEFCLASLDNKVRYLPDEHIKQTLLHLMEHGRVIKFLDRTFNMKRDFTIDIFTFILANHRPGNVFQFEITADILHPDIIRFIQEKVPVGLFRFEIGIQTVNQKANLEVSRKQNFDKTKGIIQALSDRVEMHLDLIVGLPLERWEDIKFSFEEVFKLFAPELQMGFLKFLKGTPVREKYEQHGFVFDPEPPYQIIESNYLTRLELARLEVVEHALEIFWNKPRAPRTLKYVTATYSIFDFMLGLGECFGAVHDYHKYKLSDVYERILFFVKNNYPDDLFLPELIEIDYCLYQKDRPRPLYLTEIGVDEKAALISALESSVPKSSTGKTRFLALPLQFDPEILEQENRIEPGAHTVMIRYDGSSRGQAFYPNQIAELFSLRAR